MVIIPKSSNPDRMAQNLAIWDFTMTELLIAVQWILLKKDANKIELLLQVVISFVFGYFIALSMWLLKAFAPAPYPIRIISLLLGCTIIAFGAYLEVVADVVMLELV